MIKPKPDSGDETYFDSLKKKLLNQKIIVFVIILTIIISGIAIFIGNVEQIGKFFLAGKRPASLTDSSGIRDSNQLKKGIPSAYDSLHIDSARKKTDIISNAGLDKGFESPPAHVIKERQSENNPEIEVASIKIQESIAWREIVFAQEEKNRIIRIRGQRNPTAEFMHYQIYDPQYLKQCDQIFMLGRYKEAIDPCFDITLLNKGRSPQILTRIGVEILKAYFTRLSLGDIESRRVNVMGRYKVEFPSPEKVNIEGDIINLKKNNLELSYNGSDPSIGRSNKNDTTPVKTITGKLMDINSLFELMDLTYADVPKTVMIDLNDTIYIDQNQAFRFLLQITNSRYIPTQTLIKLVFKTDKG